MLVLQALDHLILLVVLLPHEHKVLLGILAYSCPVHASSGAHQSDAEGLRGYTQPVQLFKGQSFLVLDRIRLRLGG